MKSTIKVKTMNQSELTARINKFMDRKLAKTIDTSELVERKTQHGHRRFADVTGSPYIALAIR